MRAREGDERAFGGLVDRYHGSLTRVARMYVPTAAVAEEAVQDTWLAVLRGIDRFEGRSSFKTWLFRILVNRARSAGMREPRALSLELEGPSVDPACFDAKGGWVRTVEPWTESDDRLVAASRSGALVAALEGLPERQREVIVLRDVEGVSSADVCQMLDISEVNQRVLLHRARNRLRSALEADLAEGGR